MNEKIKEAFEQVQADSELKEKTKEFLFQKTNGYKTVKRVNYRRLVPAFASMAILLFGGHWLYFTPTVTISIDVNPSVELGINRFDRIISFKSYNDDGQELIKSLDVKFMDYSDAVNQIIESEDIASLLANDGIMTIAVIGTDSPQSEEILSDMQSCTSEKSNTYCYYTHAEEVKKAHKTGLSYGKYKAYLELQALDPSITADKVRSMTMGEIKEKINALSGDGKNGKNHFENGSQRRENMDGRGRKNRRRKAEGE